MSALLHAFSPSPTARPTQPAERPRERDTLDSQERDSRFENELNAQYSELEEVSDTATVKDVAAKDGEQKMTNPAPDGLPEPLVEPDPVAAPAQTEPMPTDRVALSNPLQAVSNETVALAESPTTRLQAETIDTDAPDLRVQSSTLRQTNAVQTAEIAAGTAQPIPTDGEAALVQSTNMDNMDAEMDGQIDTERSRSRADLESYIKAEARTEIRADIKAEIKALQSTDTIKLSDSPKLNPTNPALLIGEQTGTIKALPVSLTSAAPIQLSGMSDRLAATILQTTNAAQSAPVTLDKVPQAVVAVALSAKSATLQIDPPELGRIQLDYQFDPQGRTVVTLTPESDAARAALLDRMATITAALEQGAAGAIDVKLADARDFGASYNEASDDSQDDRKEPHNSDISGSAQAEHTTFTRAPAGQADRLHMLV